jgi:hypothetical protein
VAFSSDLLLIFFPRHSDALLFDIDYFDFLINLSKQSSDTLHAVKFLTALYLHVMSHARDRRLLSTLIQQWMSLLTSDFPVSECYIYFFRRFSSSFFLSLFFLFSVSHVYGYVNCCLKIAVNDYYIICWNRRQRMSENLPLPFYFTCILSFIPQPMQPPK